MRYNIFILMSLLFIYKAEAQNNTNKQNASFNLELNIPTQKGNKVYLGKYWNDATYAIDSTLISEQGKATFHATDMLPAGQYFLYIKPDFQIDLLLDKEQSNIQIYIDENDFSKSTALGHNGTSRFWDYLAIMQELGNKKVKINDPNTPADELTVLKKEYEMLDKRKQEYIRWSKDEQSWYASFIKGMQMVTLPYPEPKNEEEYIKNKEYGKAHFFDNIDLTDPRFWRTNYFTSYIDTYMKQWVDQIPDSVAAAASRLVEKTKKNDFCFKEMLSKLVNQSMKSTVMGDENIWARLAEDYIFDKNISWIDSAQTSEIRKMYESIKNNRIGMQAKNLTLETIDGKTINTNEISSEYLLLYFYDPGCGHCKAVTPILHTEIYAKYKEKGLEIVAIDIASDKQAWKDFINEFKLTDWINCADPGYKSQYWMNYDISGIPSSFVLDKNKVIVAKKIDEKNLEKLFDFYFKDKDGTN